MKHVTVVGDSLTGVMWNVPAFSMVGVCNVHSATHATDAVVHHRPACKATKGH